ncbi:hypothetical protein [Viridibacterium curvum]|uniref:Uncharacterized protein n=1 Tax=Viridibacterium curvum TaxID=1101404 RepID=A0ABP9QPF0_9RHOO
MNESATIVANHWDSSSSPCECCGQYSQQIWGDLSLGDTRLAAYFVHWTEGRPDHLPNLDLIIGPWGNANDSANRILVTLLFKPSANGGSFMVTDASSRAGLYGDLFGRAMLRAEVVGTPLASEVFALVDALWLTEPRIAEVKVLNRIS